MQAGQVSRQSTDLRPFLGIPWEQLSCWQLVAHIYATMFGIDLPTYDNADPEDRALVACLIESGRADWFEVPIHAVEHADVLLFREDRLQPTHVAMAVDEAWMLHVRKGGRSRMDLWDGSFRGLLWRPRLVGVWRHKHLASASTL